MWMEFRDSDDGVPLLIMPIMIHDQWDLADGGRALI